MKYFSCLKTKRERGDIPLVRNKLIALLAILTMVVSGYAQAQPAPPLQLDLALCIDSSGSISTSDPDGVGPLLSEWETQIQGYISSLQSLIPTNGSVRLSVFEFSTGITTHVSPLKIDSQTDLNTVTQAIDDIVPDGNLTNIGGCVIAATDAIVAAQATEASLRQVIDVSTDGSNTAGDSPATGRAAAIAGNIDALNVIGIAIGAGAEADMRAMVFPDPGGSPLGDKPNPGDPVDEDGFVLVVAGFTEFVTAIEVKLQLELFELFTVTKEWAQGDPPGEVTIQLTCPPGVIVNENSNVDTEVTDQGYAYFGIRGHLDSDTCTAVELTDTAGWNKDESNCENVLVSAGACTITNTAMNPAMTILKESTTTLITAAGQQVPYTFLVTNTGNVTLTNIVVTDVTVDAPGVVCPGNTLAPAAFMICNATRTVAQGEWDAGNGGTLDNIGIANSNETDPVEDPHSIPFADDGRIEIALVLDPPLGDAFDFLGATPATLGHGDDSGVWVRPGAYETRTAKAAIFLNDWIVASFDCNDGDSVIDMNDPDDLIALFNVAPAETVRCTLTLRLAPDLPVPVNSPLALLLLTLMMLTAGWYFRPATMRKF